MIKIELTYHQNSLQDKLILSRSYLHLAEIINEEWLKPIYHFLSNWYNENDYINIKTSGSTGKPKLIQVQKSAMIFSAKQTINYFNLKKGDHVLLCLPCEYIGGMMMIVRAIIGELSLFAIEPKLNLEFNFSEKFVFAAMIPNQVSNYLEQNQNSIQKIIIGGATVPKHLESKISNYKNTDFWSTYGMTETVSHIALRKLNGNNSSDYFIPLKNILVGKDERDCLTIYNRNYNENVIITNDIVDFNLDNCFKIVGRYDLIINSGGLKINPEELEIVIEELTTKRCLIFGIHDDKLGEKVVLLMEDLYWDSTTLNLFQKTIKDKFGNKTPKEIYFLERFINTPNEKLDRKKTIQLFKESSN